MDAGPMDAGPPDAGPLFDGGPTSRDAAIGAECNSNFDCASSQFCACTETPPSCLCQVGSRGTGATGTACSMNSDCASGICFSDNGVDACTRPCATVEEDSPGCGGLFPACRDISAFLGGRLCATSEADAGT